MPVWRRIFHSNHNNSLSDKWIRIGSGLVFVLLSIALNAQSETIKIGLTGPFTGGSSPMGESMRNGVRLAVEEINSIGGIRGKQIELIERDDQANNELGARIANPCRSVRLRLAPPPYIAISSTQFAILVGNCNTHTACTQFAQLRT